ncbi:GNAT family N-acetyltransferase [Bradyrhizobium sp. CB1650]|uniref:GNAT family N-acetyltransferase n=1 Tax=Bradyrhizobium sp. CB1650 TaxID=3039153 RepID=UPI002434CCEF|nr:GNAT family N-acetyltransferase [Bradyrhizobium sp. CB1650]WGD50772.1 GNAT family N-acetyltransferase [Bradyrhizobium sp. CB1650]
MSASTCSRMTYELFSLRERPQYLTAVAEWIHRQWWAGTATPIEDVELWLNGHLGNGGFPTTLVLIADGELAGSVSLHETEAEDRPSYRPYLGALFVKQAYRGRGFGVALVRVVEAHARKLGHSAIYLNAADPVTHFYEALGWQVIERGYGRKKLNILQRNCRLDV